MTLGQRLHHFRRARHLSQSEVAAALGPRYTQQQVSAWERDQRRLPVLVLPALVQMLGLPTVDALLRDETVLSVEDDHA